MRAVHPYLWPTLVLALAGTGLAQAPRSVPGPTPRPTPTPPAELAGRILLKGADGKTIPGVGSVVWLPDVQARPVLQASVTSQEKRFEPHVIAVSRGARVSFPNVDRIYHNVFSRSPGNEFDLGLYRKGASRSFAMKAPGLVRVYCNIHPQMAAYVMVLDGAAFAVAGEDGRYRIDDLPSGRRFVHVWNERGGEQEYRVDLNPGRQTTLDAALDASAYRQVPHKNKHGKDYPPVRDDDDRY